jgi:protein TonB
MRPLLLFIAVLAGAMLLAADEKPYKVGGSVSPPQVIHKVEPEYTQEALAARRQGTVRIQLVVTTDGATSEVHEVGQSLGFGLDEKAVEAAQQWRFKPGEKSGQPVPVLVQIEMNFRPPR